MAENKNNSKNPVGRPETYSYTDKWQEWIDEWKQFVISEKQLPSLERLTRYLQDKLKAECKKHICINTVRSYGSGEESKPEFMEALDWAALEQRIDLIEKGLSGEFNPTIAKLILSANHGMHEKTESDQNVKLTAMGRIIKDGKEFKVEVG